MMVDGIACQAPITDLACRQNNPRPRYRFQKYFTKLDSSITRTRTTTRTIESTSKPKTQYPSSVFCHLSSVS